MLGNGILCPVRLFIDFWPDGDGISTTKGNHLSFLKIIEVADQKINAYINGISKGDNIMVSMAKHLFGEENFQERLKNSMNTSNGKIFYNDIANAKSVEDYRKAALFYLNKIRKDRGLAFGEMAIASIILANLNSGLD